MNMIKTCTMALCGLFFLLATTGCIKMQQVMTLMPDGSGKVEMVFGMNDMMLQMAAQNGEDPFADLTMETMAEETEGFVAFTAPERFEEDGYTMMRITAYFEDINDIELEGMESVATYEYEVTADGYTLEVSESQVRAMAESIEGEMGGAQMGPDEKEMVEGFHVLESYILPGEIFDADGLDTDGNTLSLEILGEHLVTQKVPEGYSDDTGLVISGSTDGVSDEALAEFHAEMQEAIAEYDRMLGKESK